MLNIEFEKLGSLSLSLDLVTWIALEHETIAAGVLNKSYDSREEPPMLVLYPMV